MDDPTQDDFKEPANIRFLRRLVTTLTAVMILGVLVIIALLVTRLSTQPAPLPLPQTIALPDGAAARAFTQGDSWYAVVTDTDEILIYDRTTNALRQRITID